MAAIERKRLTGQAAPGADNPVRASHLSLVRPGRALPPSPSEAAGELVFEAKGWRAWWRTLQIARVLGTMALYLFLNDYDVRASFMRRAADARLGEARGRGRLAYFRAWARDL